MLLSSKAIVLKSFPYSNTSIISRLYTEDYGKVSVMAKGARRPKNPLASTLEPLNGIHVNYFSKESRGLQNLKEANSLYIVKNIREDMHSLTTGLTILDILDHTCIEQDPSPILYRLVTKCVNVLEENPGLYKEIFWFFMLQLAIRSGFKPNLDRCGGCLCTMSECVLDIHTGMLSCRNCISIGDNDLNPPQLQVLKKLIVTHINNLSNIELSDKLSNGITQFLLSFLKIHMQGMEKVKSLKIIDQLL